MAQKDHKIGPKTGFFHFFKPKEVMVYRWDPANEDMVDMDTVDQAQAARFRSGTYAFCSNCFLGESTHSTPSMASFMCVRVCVV